MFRLFDPKQRQSEINEDREADKFELYLEKEVSRLAELPEKAREAVQFQFSKELVSRETAGKLAIKKPGAKRFNKINRRKLMNINEVKKGN